MLFQDFPLSRDLIPIPPLDGSRVLRFFLPEQAKQTMDRLSGPVGIVLLIVFINFGGARFLLPVFLFLRQVFVVAYNDYSLAALLAS